MNNFRLFRFRKPHTESYKHFELSPAAAAESFVTVFRCITDKYINNLIRYFRRIPEFRIITTRNRCGLRGNRVGVEIICETVSSSYGVLNVFIHFFFRYIIAAFLTGSRKQIIFVFLLWNDTVFGTITRALHVYTHTLDDIARGLCKVVESVCEYGKKINNCRRRSSVSSSRAPECSRRARKFANENIANNVCVCVETGEKKIYRIHIVIGTRLRRRFEWRRRVLTWW